MTSDPDFLSLEEILVLHEEQLARYGGAGGVRDLGLLESAVAMPLATFDGQLVHCDRFAIAAAYAFHIAQNQALRRREQANRSGGSAGLPRPERGGDQRP